MASRWIFDERTEGSLTLYHQASDFTLVPGEIVMADEPPVLQRIELSWRKGEAPFTLKFKVESMSELDPIAAHPTGPSRSIAGLFSFVANTKTMVIEAVFPGDLPVDLTLSTLSQYKLEGANCSTRELTHLLAKDSLRAAQEIVRPSHPLSFSYSSACTNLLSLMLRRLVNYGISLALLPNQCMVILLALHARRGLPTKLVSFTRSSSLPIARTPSNVPCFVRHPSFFVTP